PAINAINCRRTSEINKYGSSNIGTNLFEVDWKGVSVMNMKRIGAIFEKDLKDFMKNMMLMLMPVVPIVLSLFYRQLCAGEEMPLQMIYIIIGVIFSTVTANCIMAMMAEEKEKKTLKGLIMSPASFADVIIGKSLVTGLMTL